MICNDDIYAIPLRSSKLLLMQLFYYSFSKMALDPLKKLREKHLS